MTKIKCQIKWFKAFYWTLNYVPFPYVRQTGTNFWHTINTMLRKPEDILLFYDKILSSQYPHSELGLYQNIWVQYEVESSMKCSGKKVVSSRKSYSNKLYQSVIH